MSALRRLSRQKDEAASIVHHWYSKAREDTEIVETIVSGNQQIKLANAIAAALQSKQAELDAKQADVDRLQTANKTLETMLTKISKLKGVEMLRQERDKLDDELTTLNGQYDSLVVKNAKLRAELDEAIEALRPFADFHEATQSVEESDHQIIKEWFHPNGMSTTTITHGHCRQAAAIVARHVQGSKEGGK